MKYVYVFLGMVGLIFLSTGLIALAFTLFPLKDTSGELSIPSDPKATYIVIEKGGTAERPTLTTNRIGTSGEGDSYAKRIFDCRAGTTKYLADSETLEGLKKSKPDKKMGKIIEGSIAWYQYRYVCPEKKNSEGAVSKRD